MLVLISELPLVVTKVLFMLRIALEVQGYDGVRKILVVVPRREVVNVLLSQAQSGLNGTLSLILHPSVLLPVLVILLELVSYIVDEGTAVGANIVLDIVVIEFSDGDRNVRLREGMALQLLVDLVSVPDFERWRRESTDCLVLCFSEAFSSTGWVQTHQLRVT